MLPFLADVPDPWIHWGAVVGVVIGVIGIIAAVAKAAQWVDHRNVEQIESAVAKITQTNGGHSLRDDVKRACAIGEANAASIAELRGAFEEKVDEYGSVISASNESRARFERHMHDHEALGWSEGASARR